MVVGPRGKKLLAGTPLRVIIACEQLSLAVGTPILAALITTPQLVAPAPVPMFTSGGAVIVGATVSTIVIVTVAVSVPPLPSLTVYVYESVPQELALGV